MQINTRLKRDTHATERKAARLAGLQLGSVLFSLVMLSCSDVSAPGGADEAIANVSAAVTSQTVSSNWQCPTGVSCEDIYDMDLPGGTFLTIRVTQITGSSFLRLYAFTNANSGTNLLTGATKHWNCKGTGTDTVTFKTPSTATYRVALGRDSARSAGNSGNYTVTFESSSTMTFRGRTSNNITSIDFPSLCGWEHVVTASFSCNPGPTCQNVWDYDVQAGSAMTLGTGAPSSTAALSQRLHAPGVALGGHGAEPVLN